MRREQIHQLLETLTEREKGVIALRYGIDDGTQRTLEEVGKYFGVTRERIRQIEGKALKKLKKLAIPMAGLYLNETSAETNCLESNDDCKSILSVV